MLHTGWGGRVNRPYALAVVSGVGARATATPRNCTSTTRRSPIQTKGDVDPGARHRPRPKQRTRRAAARRAGAIRFLRRALPRMRRARVTGHATALQPAHAAVDDAHAREEADDHGEGVRRLSGVARDLSHLSRRRVRSRRAASRARSNSRAAKFASPPLRRKRRARLRPNIAWGQITRYMYADDSPESNTPSALSDDLIRAAVFDAGVAPARRSGSDRSVRREASTHGRRVTPRRMRRSCRSG